MLKLWIAVFIAAIAGTAVVQGATPYERDYASPGLTAPICRTSGVSPNVADCQAAIKKLGDNCYQSNPHVSLCTSPVTVGTVARSTSAASRIRASWTA
ncbi:hypothetical protein C8Q80DRAFT_1275634 [Daedaleopsis nitida]|nr:hypothetical protein C8Q80DRAFT_1275634 [Daedaleopsis nitida]